MPHRAAAVAAAALLSLAGCVGAAPLHLPDDHPASPKADAGFVDAPAALSGYRSAEDFATAPGEAASSSISAGHSHHAGMDHGGMPGMTHGEAPSSGAAVR